MNFFSEFKNLKEKMPLLRTYEAERDAAIQQGQALALPNKKQDDWRYFPTSILKEIPFQYGQTVEKSVDHLDMQRINSFCNSQFLNIVFVNGKLFPSLSDIHELPEGVQIREEQIAAIDADKNPSFFNVLNRAYTPQQYFLTISKAITVSKPIQIIQYGLIGKDAWNFSRLSVYVGSQAKAEILIRNLGDSAIGNFDNSNLFFKLGESASLELCITSEEAEESRAIRQSFVRLEKNSNFKVLTIQAESKVSRQDLHVLIAGQGVEAKVLGASVSTGSQIIDNQTLIEFQKGESQAEQLYKSILADQSRTAFTGKVYIAPDAQKANSSQLNNNLSLSSSAEADSRPQLEIYADDVKAAHGSTVGRISNDELFYLQSRGISKAEALPMLGKAFLVEVVMKLESFHLQTVALEVIEKSLKKVKVSAFGDQNV